ncbi:metallophosphoesterase family protein [Novipirellula artificiosorum]|uniref:3',5'-cyclic adenosine monophosphate phosphodiesterase CpdA n=1 Tax=Novipirellula artificiosorum TaxID=2528016 RepID=A0A5C6DZ44_9BACT|nr:metallophosphoesterase [Novipirellula artificiosorum]TWU41097.1 3',5'-cyclic adenosine monophosphate phosphodiesterase CpdA [Novipirellula artificiosorum]
MPIHFASQSRRTFLRSLSAAGTVAFLASHDRVSAASESTRSPAIDKNLIALLSDTHIPRNPSVEAHGVNMTDNLNDVISQISSLSVRPANLLINGDCAYLKGLPTDYANLANCLAPLDDLGISLHVTMGNHDDRTALYETFSEQRPAAAAVASKHVSVLECEFVNWFLLDTLTQVNVVTGEVGNEQLQWLARELDARRDKPAIVMAHHTPQYTEPEPGKPWSGISDTAAFFDVLDNRSHVRGFLYGHSHKWNVEERRHIKLVNLPPVAYLFSQGLPNGWVSARMSNDSLHLELQTLNPKHPDSHQQVEISWS